MRGIVIHRYEWKCCVILHLFTHKATKKFPLFKIILHISYILSNETQNLHFWKSKLSDEKSAAAKYFEPFESQKWCFFKTFGTIIIYSPMSPRFHIIWPGTNLLGGHLSSGKNYLFLVDYLQEPQARNIPEP